MSDPIFWDAPDADHPARRMAQRSFRTVANGDRAAWLALFEPDAVVADPVGPSPFDPEGTGHRGHDAIGAFWDQAIAPVDEFEFHITDSFANGNASASVGWIVTRIGDLVIRTEGVFIHRLGDSGLMESMQAHWEWNRALASARGRESEGSSSPGLRPGRIG